MKHGYGDLVSPYSVADAFLLSTYLAAQAKEASGVEFFHRAIIYTDAQEFFLRHALDVRGITHAKKLAFHLTVPSPTIATGKATHAVALFVNHETREIHYQDSHGLLMPAPLLEHLQLVFPQHTIINHRAIQQTDGDLSCMPLAVENLHGFILGEKPHARPDITAIRTRHLAHFRKMRASSFDPTDINLLESRNTEEVNPDLVASFWNGTFPHSPPKEVPDKPLPEIVYRPPHPPQRTRQPDKPYVPTGPLS